MCPILISFIPQADISIGLHVHEQTIVSIFLTSIRNFDPTCMAKSNQNSRRTNPSYGAICKSKLINTNLTDMIDTVDIMELQQ